MLGCVGNAQPSEPCGHPLWSEQALAGVCPKGAPALVTCARMCTHILGVRSTGVPVSPSTRHVQTYTDPAHSVPVHAGTGLVGRCPP